MSEFQLVYITHGRGVFESEPTGRVRIEAGHSFLLFPGVWHRYRPVRAVGWDEHWIGFDGDYARTLMGRFFSPERAVLRVGHDERLLGMFREMAVIEKEAGFGAAQMMASLTLQALARIRHLAAGRNKLNRGLEQKIAEARCLLLERANQTVDMRNLARELGLSYQAFRAAFTRQTGMPPGQYHLEIRLNKAKEALGGPLTIGQIADQLGISVYYFSRLFRKKTGQSPSQWRQHRT